MTKQALTANEAAILSAVEKTGTTDPAEVAEASGKSEASVKMTMRNIEKKGHDMTTNDTKETITSAMDEALEADTMHQEATDTTPPKKKAKRKNPEAIQEEATQEEAPEEPTKPEPVAFHGYEVKDGTDLSELESEASAAKAAFAKLGEKEKTGLDEYLTVGRFQHRASEMFKNTKTMGAYIKQEMPESQAMDAPLRSAAKWLYAALNVPESEGYDDLLSKLELDTSRNDRTEALREYKSVNPTVIKRDYKKACKEADKRKELEEEGIDADDEEAIAAREQAEKNAKAERIEAAIQGYVAGIKGSQKQRDNVEQAIRALMKSKDEGIEYLESMAMVPGEETEGRGKK